MPAAADPMFSISPTLTSQFDFIKINISYCPLFLICRIYFFTGQFIFLWRFQRGIARPWGVREVCFAHQAGRQGSRPVEETLPKYIYRCLRTTMKTCRQIVKVFQSAKTICLWIFSTLQLLCSRGTQGIPKAHPHKSSSWWGAVEARWGLSGGAVGAHKYRFSAVGCVDKSSPLKQLGVYKGPHTFPKPHTYDPHKLHKPHINDPLWPP